MDILQGTDWTVEDLVVREGEAVLASAEGGDRVLRLLAARPKRVAVVDRHRPQLYLLDLKLAAVKALSYGDYLEFLGNRPSRRRRALYQRIRWILRKEADDFWLARLGMIDRGVAQQGRFERQLASFRQFVRLVHGGRKVQRFQSLSTEEERRAMYAREWQTFLWRKFGGLLWDRWFAVGPERLERLLFDGKLLAPPPEMTEPEFCAAKELANRVLIVDEAPESYLRNLPGASVDAFLLGRMELAGLDSEIRRVARPGARIGYVADRGEEAPPQGFVPAGPPRDAEFFPGHWVAAVLPA